MLKKIGIIVDSSREAIYKNEETRHQDHQKTATLESIKQALERKYDVTVFEANVNLASKLLEDKPDLVFNLSSGIVGECRQSQVPAILEMLRIPYTGSGIMAHCLALHKGMAKRIFLQNGVPTPRFQIFTSIDEQLDESLNFPLIVKPSCEGSGMGIYRDSLVYGREQLYSVVRDRLEKYKQAILVEEFIEGREFTVGVLGNDPDIKVLPILEINFDRVPDEYGKFYTFETKTKMGHLTNYYCPAPISDELKEKIEKAVVSAYRSLDCRDISRVDIRVKGEEPYVLEINTLPGLKKGYSDLPKMAEVAGMTYEQLIDFIVESAVKRYGII